MLEVDTARADLVDCTLQDNHIMDQHEGVVQGINNASISLHRPSFSGNSGSGHLLHFNPDQHNQATSVGSRTNYFCDEPSVEGYCEERLGEQAVLPLRKSDTNLVAMQSWLQQKRMVLICHIIPTSPTAVL